jgi:tetratricopeptide (TPR) repeat protein
MREDGMKHYLAAALLVAALAPGAAEAAASIVGTGYARKCYEAAEARQPGRNALRVCDSALMDEGLGIGDRAKTLVNRGILQMQAKNLAAAIADYDAAIRTAPDTAEAYVNKGLALMRLGHREVEAIDQLTEGLIRNPARPEVAYFSRGVLNELLGNTREAYNDYSRAVELAPDWREPAEELQRFQVIPKKKTAGV